MPEITNDEIADLARSPERARSDEGSVQERKVSELIAAQRHAQGASVTFVPWGMRIAVGRPPGTV